MQACQAKDGRQHGSWKQRASGASRASQKPTTMTLESIAINSRRQDAERGEARGPGRARTLPPNPSRAENVQESTGDQCAGTTSSCLDGEGKEREATWHKKWAAWCSHKESVGSAWDVEREDVERHHF